MGIEGKGGWGHPPAGLSGGRQGGFRGVTLPPSAQFEGADHPRSGKTQTRDFGAGRADPDSEDAQQGIS